MVFEAFIIIGILAIIVLCISCMFMGGELMSESPHPPDNELVGKLMILLSLLCLSFIIYLCWFVWRIPTWQIFQ